MISPPPLSSLPETPTMANSKFKMLDNFDDVVEALGGYVETGRLCDDQNSAAVYNWKRRRGWFPPKYFPVMIDELNARGYDAPLGLWGFYRGKDAVDAA